ncbi:hypothetical protein ACFCYH_05235 [Streptomyces sp. NPDC056400]|uniref:hypothetical protein n=1 Tax=Streptomyces sp. NPDC056400 TaxID=3345808 RepID=UPI0035D76A82
MYFSESGLDEQEERSFALHGSDIVFRQSVKRFDSPTWAWLYLRRTQAQDKP